MKLPRRSRSARRPPLRALAGLALLAVPLLTARARVQRNSVSSNRMALKEESGQKEDERGSNGREVASGSHSLPDRETCLTVLEKMMLIRRFEERAGEMYAKAKIGGFLHLCIGEEATVVGATQALRESDYLMSTYREHGQALARGTSPDAVMAELFGRVDG
ncbi:MAG: pyruvate dehydrogenase component alpha subunit, partial [Thermoleophilaceae bacterium]|nr:pyruvate dehydrogenase component alpha subunit [Thermoleophilaceae bacterium]